MKTVLTFIAILTVSLTSMAQTTKEVKVEVETLPIELNIDLNASENTVKEVARLYRYKNSRIKKELAFRTKKSRAKLA